MKPILTLFTSCLLLLSGLRLATLDKQELQQYRASKIKNVLVPSDSSLVGIDAGGNLKVAKLGDDGHLVAKGHLVVFVIHRDSVVEDVQYWNRVIGLVGGFHPGIDASMQYWGICDDGSTCNSYQSIAHFSILGYLDAYEMRAVATADASQEALLYNESMRLAARIPRSTDPSVESTLIMGKAK